MSISDLRSIFLCTLHCHKHLKIYWQTCDIKHCFVIYFLWYCKAEKTFWWHSTFCFLYGDVKCDMAHIQLRVISWEYDHCPCSVSELVIFQWLSSQSEGYCEFISIPSYSSPLLICMPYNYLLTAGTLFKRVIYVVEDYVDSPQLWLPDWM